VWKTWRSIIGIACVWKARKIICIWYCRGVEDVDGGGRRCRPGDATRRHSRRRSRTGGAARPAGAAGPLGGGGSTRKRARFRDRGVRDERRRGLAVSRATLLDL
jgi:hypothetical protein